MLTIAQLIDSFDAHYRVLISAGQSAKGTLNWYKSAFAKLRAVAGGVTASELRNHNLAGIPFNNHFVRSLKAW